jgi:hypothetical protein
MFADDDPHYSPLWQGHRAPFHAFQEAVFALAGAYDLREARTDDPASRIRISVDDVHGTPIVPSRTLPVAAFDDVLFAVQQLRNRRHEENRASGWTDQVNADRRAARWERWEARGADMADFRAGLRERFARAAHCTEQPALLIGRPAKPGETPNKKGVPVAKPRPTSSS